MKRFESFTNPKCNNYDYLKEIGEVSMTKRKGIFYGWWIVLGGLLLVTLTVPFTSALVGLYMLPITEEFNIPTNCFYIYSFDHWYMRDPTFSYCREIGPKI